MAAILCDTIGKICSLPCQLCGVCTKGCVSVFGDCCKACGPCCRECCQGMSGCCQAVGKAVCSPFFPYLFLTAVLNLPPAIWGIQARPGCGGSMWLWVNAAFCLLHMVVGLYAVVRILKAQDSTLPTATTGTAIATSSSNPDRKHDNDVESNNHRSTTLRNRVINVFTHERSSADDTTTGGRAQMKQVLCYDPIVAVYLLSFLGWLAWLCFGISFLAVDDDDSECSGNRNAVFLSLGTGFAYTLLVCCTIPCAYACLR
jgi:hypothetical protein